MTGLWSTWGSDSAQILLPWSPKPSWLPELPQGPPEDACPLSLEAMVRVSSFSCLVNPFRMLLSCLSGPRGKLKTSEIPKNSSSWERGSSKKVDTEGVSKFQGGHDPRIEPLFSDGEVSLSSEGKLSSLFSISSFPSSLSLPSSRGNLALLSLLN